MPATPRSQTSPASSRRLIGAALGLVLVVAAAPFFSTANAAQPAGDATAAAETDVVTGANASDPAIWVNPQDATKSLIFGADDTRLVTYDMTWKLKAQSGLPSTGVAGDFTGVDARNAVTPTGATSAISVATAVGNGKLHFYAINPTTDAVTDVSATAGGIDMTAPTNWQSGKISSVCMYQSKASGKTYAFVMSANGQMAQLELKDSSGKIAATAVRGGKGAVWDPTVTTVPSNVSSCVADDATGTLYVAVTKAGIMKFGAEPTDPTTGTFIDTPATATPAGHLLANANGLAMVSTGDGVGYLVASTKDAGTSAADGFNVYDRAAGNAYIRTFKIGPGPNADGCDLSEAIDAAPGNFGANFAAGMFVCQDKQNRTAVSGSGFDLANYKMVALDQIVDPAGPVPTTVTTAPQVTPTTVPAQTPNRSGYWMVGSDGRVYSFGDANPYGDATLAPGAQAVDLEPTPSGNGYWIIDDQGHVFAKGDAKAMGDVDRAILSPAEVVTSLSATKSGNGYWAFTSLGRVIPFGDAVSYGDMSKVKLNGPVLDSIPTASGKGYYMVGSDGGIFSFGDAVFMGSMGGKPLNKPVQSLVPDGDGSGYWLVASDGGIFAFDAPFRGSMGAIKLNKPVTGMVRYGNGYLMVGEDGGIFSFSDKAFVGSLGANPPAKPITSVAALDAPAAQ
jgi:myo-inositol-hexaphosphate 3-phosphohydrolase